MKLKILHVPVVLIMMLSFSVTTFADMTVTLRNDTKDYVFYLNHHKVLPGAFNTTTFKNHTTLSLTMDYVLHPTPWKTVGLGNGGVAYSIDPKSKQSNVSLSLSPASIGSPSTAAPSFAVSGGVSGHSKDNWKVGMHLILHGSSSKSFIKVTE